MTEAATAKQDEEKEDGSAKTNKILQVTAILLFSLNLAVSVVIMLLPLKEYLDGKFQRNPQKVLWVLFTLSLSFAILHYMLAVTENSSRKYSTLGGIAYLVVGLLCAAEIFIFIVAPNMQPNAGAFPTGLWWLFAVTTLLGALGVYLPERAKRLKEAEKKNKADEDRLKERGKRPIVLRFKAHRYYVTENKLLVYTD